MDIENMRHAWNEMNQRLTSLESEVDRINIKSKETSQQRLIKQYRAFSIIGFMFCFISWFSLKEILTPVGPKIALSIFFLIASDMDFYLMRKIQKIDVAQTSVTDVAEAAKNCRRLHHLFQLIIIPCCLGMLLWLGLSVDNEFFRIGMCSGSVIGIIVGIKFYTEFMRNYKELMKR